ncbi:unnamed protein product [Musa banksii]
MFLEGHHGLFLLGSSSHLVLEPKQLVSGKQLLSISQVVSISLLLRCMTPQFSEGDAA